MKQKEADKLAKVIWDYHHMNDKLKRSDIIIVLGSHDERVAEYAVKLYFNKWAPIICFTGGIAHKNDLLKTSWKKSEAEMFASIALKMGVPKECIFIEDKAINTGQNAIYVKELLDGRDTKPKTAILVQKPYMERRAYATFKKIWPDLDVILSSPGISYEDYPNKDIDHDTFINIMVGDLQRIKEYPKKGFQIPQMIPRRVWNAYEELVKLGYDKHLTKV